MTDTTASQITSHKQFHRKPVGNFFILRDLQIRLIAKIVGVGVLSTLVAVGTLIIAYVIKYKSVTFWAVNLGSEADISNQGNIVFIILPSLIIGTLVNIAVTACIGLYASRKYAVPIFKLEQWVQLLLKGHMSARLNFREKDELKELTQQCNLLAETFRRRFLDIRNQLDNLKKSGTQPSGATKGIEAALSDLELEAESIDVHTHFYTMPLKPGQTPPSK